MSHTIEISGKKVTFELRTTSFNTLVLEATAVDGEAIHGANVLQINGEGRYVRCFSVNKRAGLKLNDSGQIKRVK